MERTFGQCGRRVQVRLGLCVPGSTDSPKPFDRNLAYQLYRQVLGPIEEIISQKTRLSFVLDGALTSLPPQVLITTRSRWKGPRFGRLAHSQVFGHCLAICSESQDSSRRKIYCRCRSSR